MTYEQALSSGETLPGKFTGPQVIVNDDGSFSMSGPPAAGGSSPIAVAELSVPRSTVTPEMVSTGSTNQTSLPRPNNNMQLQAIPTQQVAVPVPTAGGQQNVFFSNAGTPVDVVDRFRIRGRSNPNPGLANIPQIQFSVTGTTGTVAEPVNPNTYVIVSGNVLFSAIVGAVLNTGTPAPNFIAPLNLSAVQLNGSTGVQSYLSLCSNLADYGLFVKQIRLQTNLANFGGKQIFLYQNQLNSVAQVANSFPVDVLTTDMSQNQNIGMLDFMRYFQGPLLMYGDQALVIPVNNDVDGTGTAESLSITFSFGQN